EVERALSTVRTLGFELPPRDDGRLAICRPAHNNQVRIPFDGLRYVVVHPGASVPARAWAPHRSAELVRALVDSGCAVAVTGSPAETEIAAAVAGPPDPAIANLAGT